MLLVTVFCFFSEVDFCGFGPCALFAVFNGLQMFSAARHSEPQVEMGGSNTATFIVCFLLNMALYVICAIFHVLIPYLLPYHFNDYGLAAIIFASEAITLILFKYFIWGKTRYGR